MSKKTELVERLRSFSEPSGLPAAASYSLMEEAADALEAAEAELTQRDLVIREVPTVVSSMIDDSLFDDDYSYDGILTELRARMSVSAEQLGLMLDWLRRTDPAAPTPVDPPNSVGARKDRAEAWDQGLRHGAFRSEDIERLDHDLKANPYRDDTQIKDLD